MEHLANLFYLVIAENVRRNGVRMGEFAAGIRWVTAHSDTLSIHQVRRGYKNKVDSEALKKSSWHWYETKSVVKHKNNLPFKLCLPSLPAVKLIKCFTFRLWLAKMMNGSYTAQTSERLSKSPPSTLVKLLI